MGQAQEWFLGTVARIAGGYAEGDRSSNKVKEVAYRLAGDLYRDPSGFRVGRSGKLNALLLGYALAALWEHLKECRSLPREGSVGVATGGGTYLRRPSEGDEPSEGPTDGEVGVVSEELYLALWQEPRTPNAGFQNYGVSSMRAVLAARLIRALDDFRAQRAKERRGG